MGGQVRGFASILLRDHGDLPQKEDEGAGVGGGGN